MPLQALDQRRHGVILQTVKIDPKPPAYIGAHQWLIAGETPQWRHTFQVFDDIDRETNRDCRHRALLVQTLFQVFKLR